MVKIKNLHIYLSSLMGNTCVSRQSHGKKRSKKAKKKYKCQDEASIESYHKSREPGEKNESITRETAYVKLNIRDSRLNLLDVAPNARSSTILSPYYSICASSSTSRIEPPSLAIGRREINYPVELNRKKPRIELIGGICGLINLGNTCYMNSTLQCLSNVPPIQEFVRKFKYPSRKSFAQRSLIRIFGELIQQLWSGNNRIIEPKQFKTKISHIWDRFSGWDQCDSSELLSSILNRFHEELLTLDANRHQNNSNYIKFDDYLRDNNTFIGQTFHGFQSFKVFCKRGHIFTQTNQSFSILNLPQIDNRRVVSFYLLPINKMFYKIEMKISKNSVSISELLTKTIQTFYKSSSLTLNRNNLIPVLIRENLIHKIYDTNSWIDFDDIDGNVYIYENDPTFRHYLFVILMSLQLPYSVPLLLNLKEFNLKSIKDEFYYQYGYNLSKVDNENDYIDLIDSGIDSYYVLERTQTAPGQWFPTQVLFTRPLNDQVLEKYRKPVVFTIKSDESDYINFKLEDSLRQYLSVKKLEQKLFCNECQTSVYPTEKLNILYSPKVLILQLKSNPKFQSISYNCEFPLVLNFAEYVSQTTGNYGNNIYDLIAMVNYSGSSYSGHYTAYAKNHMNGKWFDFNDSMVTEISESQLNSSNAYLLFYLKQ